jgi:hypothetical protein
MLALSISHEARPAMLGPPEGGIEWAPFRSRPTKPKTYRSWRTERRRDGEVLSISEETVMRDWNSLETGCCGSFALPEHPVATHDGRVVSHLDLEGTNATD